MPIASERRLRTSGSTGPTPRGRVEKLSEEIDELDQALASGDRAAAEAELGDVLFAAVNVARKHGIDAESALRRTIDKFAERVRHVEGQAKERGIDTAKLPMEQLDLLWSEAKEAVG